jgi:hypothetical protein
MSNTPTEAVASNAELGLAPKRPGLWIRLFARLRGGEVIWIQDFQGKVKPTIAHMDAFGGAWCPVYWFGNVGHCRLLADGTVDPKSDSSYVHRWRKA